jgi:hypothetical protein
MGRIRGREDNEYWQGVNREVFELFANSDFRLWVLCPKTAAAQDPLYGEPSNSDLIFVPFEITGFIQEFSDDAIAAELGINIEASTLAWVNRRILEDAGLKQHGTDTEMVSTGDVLEVYRDTKGEMNTGYTYYDIVNTDRKGYLNDSDKWTYMELMLRRRDSFKPERRVEKVC